MFYAGSLHYDTKLDTSGFQKGVNELTGTAKTGGATIKSIVAGLGITKIIEKSISLITNSVDDAVKRFDKLNNFPKTMESLGIGAKSAEKAVNKLSDKLTGLPTTLDSATSSVARFVSKNGDIDKSTDMFLALNNAIIAGGASLQVQEAALEQATQAYSRGKFELTEWRSLLVAMPGQVKQVSSAFGKTSDEMYDALKDGEISVDDFMNKVIELNTKGGKGFASFEEQAKNATGGIETSVTNMKTAITRGMTSVIEAIDKGLASIGLGSLSNVISNIGKTFESALKNIASIVPTTIQTIYKLRGAIIAVVGAVVLYKAVCAGMNIVQNIQNARVQWSLLKTEMSKATTAQILFNKEASSSQKLMLLLQKANLGNVFNSINSGALNAAKGLGSFASSHKLLSGGILGVVGILATLGVMLAKNGGDVGKIAEQIKNVVSNIVGTIKNIVAKIPTIINDILPKIIEIAQKELPKLINTFATNFTQIINTISTILPQVITSIVNLIPVLLPPLINGLIQLITSIISMIPTILPVIIQGLLAIVMGIVGMIGTILPPLIEALIQASIMIIEALVQALPTIILALVSAIPQIITSLSKALIKCVPTLIKAGIQIIGLIVKSIPKIIITLIKAIPSIVKSMATALINYWKLIFNVGLFLIKKLWSGFKSWVSNLKSNVLDFAKSIPEKIKSGFGKITDIGKNLVKGIWNGISNAKDWILDKIKGFGSSVVKGLKKIFKINSPSKVMRDEIGKWLPAGVAVGIEANTDSALKAIQNMSDEMYSEMKKSVVLSTGAIKSDATISSNYGFNNSLILNANFEGNVNLDSRKVGQMVAPSVTKALKTGGAK